MKLVVLDNNVFNHLVSVEGEHDRKRLEAAAARGTVQVVITAPLQEEMSATYRSKKPNSRQKAMRMVEMFFTIGKGHYLRPMRDRWTQELTLGRQLTHDEAFLRMDADILTDRAALEREVDVLAASANERKDTFIKQEQGLHKSYQPIIDQGPDRWDDEKLTAQVLADAPDLAKGYMLHQAKEIGMPAANVEGFDPRNLPSMHRLAAYIYARNFQQVHQKPPLPGRPMKVFDSDLYDQLHFTDAAYGDLLVTGDRRLRRLAHLTGLNATVISRKQPEWSNLLNE